MNRFILSVAVIILVSCSGAKHPEESQVTGQSGHLPGEWIWLKELTVNGINVLDSLQTGSDGRFTFHLTPQYTGFYLLSSEGNQLVLLIGKGDRLRITGDPGNPAGKIIIEGSPESSLLQDFFGKTSLNRKKADSLKNILEQHLGDPDYYTLSASFDTLFGSILDAQRKLETGYIRTHPGSLTSLVVLNYSFSPSPVLSLQDDFPLYHRLDSTLSAKYPGNPHVVFHHERVAEYLREQMVKKLREEEQAKKEN
jgi:hypothetical protein